MDVLSLLSFRISGRKAVPAYLKMFRVERVGPQR